MRAIQFHVQGKRVIRCVYELADDGTGGGEGGAGDERVESPEVAIYMAGTRVHSDQYADLLEEFMVVHSRRHLAPDP